MEIVKYSTIAPLAVRYDFAVDGGAIGTFVTPLIIPRRMLLTAPAGVYVLTTCTSGGAATIAIRTSNPTTLLAATAVASFTAGAFIPFPSVVNAIQSAFFDRTILIDIAGAPLTAGQFDVVLGGAKGTT